MSDNSLHRIENGGVVVEVDPAFFCSDAIVRAAHLFTDTCHVQVESASGKPVVRIVPKTDDVAVEEVAKDFHNELLDQQLRIRLQAQTGDIQKMIIAEAFAPLEHLGQEQQV